MPLRQLIQIPLPEYLRNPVAFRNALYLKPKVAEKPDDEEVLAEEHERLAAEEDDRFGAETVSLKELQEAARERDIAGRSSMNKAELIEALNASD